MRLSPAFDNAAPASVTPSRGGTFDHTAPYQKWEVGQSFESQANPSWSPANATPQTVNGIILPAPAEFNFLDELAAGMPFGSGTIYSVVINSQTVYPLLIATAGNYSIYATNAGVQYFYDPSTGNQSVAITGSVKITNPNGSEFIGAFRYDIPSQGSLSGALTAPWFMINFSIYLSNSRLTAQLSNTAPSLSFNLNPQIRLGSWPGDYLPETKFTSRFRLFSESVPIFYPTGTNYLTNRGYTFAAGSGTGSVQLRSGVFSTILTSGQSGTWFPIILTGEQSRPSLICTIGSYSFYATNAGGLVRGASVNGSFIVTGPNGFSAMGIFNFSLRLETYGQYFQGYNELWFYLNETNRFLAQPTNTAPEARL